VRQQTAAGRNGHFQMRTIGAGHTCITPRSQRVTVAQPSQLELGLRSLVFAVDDDGHVLVLGQFGALSKAESRRRSGTLKMTSQSRVWCGTKELRATLPFGNKWMEGFSCRAKLKPRGGRLSE
jgi:hypothetical protein